MKKASATTVRAVQQLLPHLKATVSRVQQRQPFFALGLDVSSSFTGYTVLTPTGACGFRVCLNALRLRSLFTAVAVLCGYFAF